MSPLTSNVGKSGSKTDKNKKKAFKRINSIEGNA